VRYGGGRTPLALSFLWFSQGEEQCLRPEGGGVVGVRREVVGCG
jgi:hypothetical protein